MNHLSDHGRSRPAGLEIAPLVAAAELVGRLQRLDQPGDTRTLSGVPLPLETAWQAQGRGPTYSRFGDTRWAAAWRMLLAHALTGWNWVADLQALELTVTGTPHTRTQLHGPWCCCWTVACCSGITSISPGPARAPTSGRRVSCG